MTDDPRTPGGREQHSAPPAPVGGRPRSRWPIGAGAAVAAVVVLALCAGAILTALRFAGIARDAAGPHEGRATHIGTACLDLETRLNRLTPPGATTSPKARAAAIRNENAAVRPFLADLERNRPDPRIDQRRRGSVDDWRQLLDARATYAEALDRQAGTGEPAFFVAPRDRRGQPLTRELEYRSGPCAAAVRRLAAPDL